MTLLSEQELNHIRSSVNIVDVISRYVPLIKKGKNFFCVCPFHDDNNPSMSVSDTKQIYTCFSCGATGNVFKFIMDYENVTFPESIKIIADIGGINIDIKSEKALPTSNKELYEIYGITNKIYQNNLNTAKGIDASTYLKERDIDEEIIKEFQIGLSLNDSTLLTNVLTKKNYQSNDLIKSGLITKTNNGYKDMYYNRIMFPLWDLNGQVVGFSGRIYHNEDTSKYINTKETEIFKKGEILYNYHRAKNDARLCDKVIVMEGFMDVIRAYTIGIKNVVATMGTAVTKNQAMIIKKMAKEIIICFDGDEAGEKATLSLIEELKNINIVPKIVRLENNLDPDDYIKKNGKDKFINKLENPINIMDFKMQTIKHKKDLTSSIDMASYVGDMIKEINTINDDILKEITLKKLSEETALDIEFLKQKIIKKQADKVEIKRPPKIILDKNDKAVMYLLYYMLNNKDVVKIYKNKGVSIINSEYSTLALSILSYYNKNKTISLADFITSNTENDKITDMISKIVLLDLNDEYVIDQIEEYIGVIKKYNIDCEIKRLMKKQKEITDEDDKLQILEQIKILRMDEKYD